jgi:hypothetical protein
MSIKTMELLLSVGAGLVLGKQIVKQSTSARNERKMITNGTELRVLICSTYRNYVPAYELILSTHTRVMKLMRYLRARYNIDKTGGDPLNMIADLILDNYNPQMIIENDPAISKDTSYAVNKGEFLYLCVRHRDNPARLVDPDVLFFVVLHELAHMGNLNWGHETDFWEIFKWILSRAVDVGLYTPVDYSVKKVQYCGMLINYNPYYDTKLRNLKA